MKAKLNIRDALTSIKSLAPNDAISVDSYPAQVPRHAELQSGNMSRATKPVYSIFS